MRTKLCDSRQGERPDSVRSGSAAWPLGPGPQAILIARAARTNHVGALSPADSGAALTGQGASQEAQPLAAGADVPAHWREADAETVESSNLTGNSSGLSWGPAGAAAFWRTQRRCTCLAGGGWRGCRRTWPVHAW